LVLPDVLYSCSLLNAGDSPAGQSYASVSKQRINEGGLSSARCLLLGKWDVSRNVFLIFRKSIAELRSQQIVLNAHSDLRADDKEQKGRQQQPPGRDQKTCAEQDAEQGGIDGMPDEAIAPGSDELVIVAKTSVDSPLAAESAGAGPGKETGKDEKDNGERGLPGLQGPFPETPLPQKRVGNGDKQYAPASAPVHLFGSLLALLGSEEWR